LTACILVAPVRKVTADLAGTVGIAFGEVRDTALLLTIGMEEGGEVAVLLKIDVGTSLVTKGRDTLGDP